MTLEAYMGGITRTRARVCYLRGRASYRDRRHRSDKTRSTPVAIGVRRATANFALLRRFALILFRLDKRSKNSLPKKRKATAWNGRDVVDLLNLWPLQKI